MSIRRFNEHGAEASFAWRGCEGEGGGGAEELFADKRRKNSSGVEEQELYEQIGRLQMELAWLKKSCPSRVA